MSNGDSRRLARVLAALRRGGTAAGQRYLAIMDGPPYRVLAVCESAQEATDAIANAQQSYRQNGSYWFWTEAELNHLIVDGPFDVPALPSSRVSTFTLCCHDDNTCEIFCPFGTLDRTRSQPISIRLRIEFQQGNPIDTYLDPSTDVIFLTREAREEYQQCQYSWPIGGQ